jgi:glycerophosphoryl diester phosphodiesterase
MRPSKLRSLLVLFYCLAQSLLLRGVVSEADSKGVKEEEESPPCYPPPLIIPPTVTTHAPKIVIAHRGASAHLPEHSLPAYRLALELDTDYIEPDLVATKDNELIAIHSMDMEITTDVAEKFPDRKTFSKYLNQTGYWSYEFTLEEVKTLRVHQRLPTARSTAFDGKHGKAPHVCIEHRVVLLLYLSYPSVYSTNSRT